MDLTAPPPPFPLSELPSSEVGVVTDTGAGLTVRYSARSFVAIPPRYGLPSRIEADFDRPAIPYLVSMEITVEPPSAIAEVHSARLQRRPDGPPVSGTGVRAVTLSRLTREAVRAARLAVEGDPDRGYAIAPLGMMTGGHWTEAGFSSAHRPAASEARRWRMTPEFLAEVAAVYRQALHDQRRDPTVAVAQHFTRPGRPVPRSTAARWVALARQPRPGMPDPPLGPAKGTTAGERAARTKRKGKR